MSFGNWIISEIKNLYQIKSLDYNIIFKNNIIINVWNRSTVFFKKLIVNKS
jgi:hypothetical protein